MYAFQQKFVLWHWRFVLTAICLFVAFAAAAQASSGTSSWPQKDASVRLIVGYAPGGGTDVLARLVAERLGSVVGVPFVVENKPGAGGTIAANMVSKATSDGYTLLFASDPELAIAPVVLHSMQYDPFTDLQPISRVASGPYMIVANAAFAPNSLPELIDHVRSNPGVVHFGSSGAGTSSHLLGEQLNRTAGIEAVHVPYKGMSAAVNDLIAGHIDYAFVPPLVARVFVEAGKLKALAIATPERIKGLETVPTTAEAGYPTLVGGAWYALMGPSGLDAEVVEQLQQAIAAVVSSGEGRAGIERLALLPQHSSPQQLSELMREEVGKWRALTADLDL